MKLESQVCSLELAKQLKELGVKQDSYFYHTVFNEGRDTQFSEVVSQRSDFYKACDNHYSACSDFYKACDNHYSAFSVAELGEMFSNSFNPAMSIDIGYNCCYYYIIFEDLDADDEKTHQVTDENEANCRAQMLVWLIENKYLDAKE